MGVFPCLQSEPVYETLEFHPLQPYFNDVFLTPLLKASAMTL